LIIKREFYFYRMGWDVCTYLSVAYSVYGSLMGSDESSCLFICRFVYLPVGM